jgi:hypothetical protein
MVGYTMWLTALRAAASEATGVERPTRSLLKQHLKKDSVAMKRRACGWNDDYLLQVLAGTNR